MRSLVKGIKDYDLDFIIQEQLDAIGSDAMGIQFETRYKPRKKETEVKFIFHINEMSSPNLFWHTQISVREDALDILHGLAEEIFQEGGEYTISGVKYDVCCTKKVNAGAYKNSIELINGDIMSINGLNDDCADYIISTYNPLSFVSCPDCVVSEAYRIVKPCGKVAITTQAYYNALFSKICNYQASAAELKYIQRNKKLFWNDFVPETWQLSKRDLENMFKKAGFRNVESRGIACITQPQDEDWDQSNVKIGKLSNKLSTDNHFFKAVLEAELVAGKDQEAVDRGMNIMTIGEK